MNRHQRFERRHRSVAANMQQIEAMEQPRRGRRRTIVMGTVLSVVAVFAFCLDIVMQEQRFPANNIVVVGNVTNSISDQVVETVAEFLDGNIFRVDIARAAEAAQSLSWVEYAKIRRKWPDTFEVEVYLRKVRARWNDSQYLDQFGTPFAPPSGIDQSLPHLKGPEISASDVLNAYEAWNNAANAVGLDIRTVELSDRGSWELLVVPLDEIGSSQDSGALVEPINIIVGSADIKDRLNRFLNIYPTIFQPVYNKVSVIDLRYPDGVAVNWKGEPPIMQGSQIIAKS